MSILLHLRARWALKAQLIPLLLNLTLCSVISPADALCHCPSFLFFCSFLQPLFCFFLPHYLQICNQGLLPFLFLIFSSYFHSDSLTCRLVPEPALKTQIKILWVIQRALQTGNVYYCAAISFSNNLWMVLHLMILFLLCLAKLGSCIYSLYANRSINPNKQKFSKVKLLYSKATRHKIIQYLKAMKKCKIIFFHLINHD